MQAQDKLLMAASQMSSVVLTQGLRLWCSLSRIWLAFLRRDLSLWRTVLVYCILMRGYTWLFWLGYLMFVKSQTNLIVFYYDSVATLLFSGFTAYYLYGLQKKQAWIFKLFFLFVCLLFGLHALNEFLELLNLSMSRSLDLELVQRITTRVNNLNAVYSQS